MKPRTRLEHFLCRIAGNPDALELEPKTRIERFLAKIAGREDAGNIEPETRLEYCLEDIAENMSPPTETMVINNNGVYDVTNYGTAEVTVQSARYLNALGIINKTNSNIEFTEPVYFTYVDSSGVTSIVSGPTANQLEVDVELIIPRFVFGSDAVKINMKTNSNFTPVVYNDEHVTVEKVSDGIIIRGLEQVDPSKNIGIRFT